MLNFKCQKILGFTLIETIVSISIVVIISALFLANYKYANRQASLTNAARKLASDIRLAQSFTLGSKEFNCDSVIKVPDGGWGVFLGSIGKNYYVIFADCNGNKVCDSSNEYYQLNTLIDNIEMDSFNPPAGSYDIVFAPPNPTTYINSQLNSSVFIILKNIITNQTKTVFVNFLGLVDVN